MPSRRPFTFGIALIPRANARDWVHVAGLLELTLRSVAAQTDGDFRVLVACHERPDLGFVDPRVEWVQVDWPVEPPGPFNDDGGRKKHVLSDLVLARGGGYLMILDADDWVDVDLVATARAAIGPDHVGGLIEAGFVADLRTLRIAPLPHPAVSDLAFHRFCGSSGVVLLRPDDRDPLRRDPFAVLRSHHAWLEVAAERGLALARLSAPGCYLVNTGENHSDRHGPYADWRPSFIARVNGAGRALDETTAARFGLDLARLRSLSVTAVFPGT